MKKRSLGNTGIAVSEIGLGCWQLGSDCWGDVDEERAEQLMDAAVAAGIDFFDTADVYGAGLSEERVGRFIARHSGGRHSGITVATKLGRMPEVYPDHYDLDTLRRSTEASIQRLGVEALDLSQLHCIPQAELDRGRAFEAMRSLQQEGLVRRWGASVETMDQALQCLEQEGLASLQIIFNIFRQTPIKRLFPLAQEKGVALIVRLPLASGLLSGKLRADATFAENDHRSFNEDGQLFNIGETFAGLGLAPGVALAGQLEALLPSGMPMAQAAMRWVLDHPAVSVVIPGATRVEQVRENAAASELPPLDPARHAALREFYREQVEPQVRGAY